MLPELGQTPSRQILDISGALVHKFCLVIFAVFQSEVSGKSGKGLQGLIVVRMIRRAFVSARPGAIPDSQLSSCSGVLGPFQFLG